MKQVESQSQGGCRWAGSPTASRCECRRTGCWPRAGDLAVGQLDKSKRGVSPAHLFCRMTWLHSFELMWLVVLIEDGQSRYGYEFKMKPDQKWLVDMNPHLDDVHQRVPKSSYAHPYGRTFQGATSTICVVSNQHAATRGDVYLIRHTAQSASY